MVKEQRSIEYGGAKPSMTKTKIQ